MKEGMKVKFLADVATVKKGDLGIVKQTRRSESDGELYCTVALNSGGEVTCNATHLEDLAPKSFSAFWPLHEDKIYNSLQRSGTLTTDPAWVIDVFNEKKGVDALDGCVERFGTHEIHIGNDHLDYAVHRALGVTLGEREQFYRDNRVYIILHAVNVWKKEMASHRPSRYMAMRLPDGWRMHPIG